MKSGYVTIVGEPNVGKSTLLNRVVGVNLAAITDKPQTTRHRILGILTENNNQIIFIDTPGLFDPRNELDYAMQIQIKKAIEGTDLLLLMITPFKKWIPDDLITGLRKPIILAINKIDIVTVDEIDTCKEEIEKDLFEEIIPISALRGDNTEELITKIYKYLPEQHPFYPPDYLSDKPERFFVSEIIREVIFDEYQQEIPYSTTVEITEMKDSRIYANIYVEKDSQKGIIIGKNGKKLKEVATQARKKIEEFLDEHIYLDVWVKVRKKWRKNKNDVQRFGYYE